ncbi:MAG: DASH family cryptochrome [Lewinellaceae bacterium]|nr:DASH family cryptochrome [Saprospiraceae bacterium]MCB9339143.1 DASH family cryptochrome [Lewinellaceae bacterium]
MEKRKGIVWFRQDLRLHDNEALVEALRHCEEIIPVYVFDERVFSGETRWFGFKKIGKYRAKFILESVNDLRRSFRKMGSDLIVRVGKPEEEIFEIARQNKTSWVFCNRERTQEEEVVQDALERNLWSIGQEMRYSRGKLLYYTADLPFPVTHTPEVFTQFKKEVERVVQVRVPLPTPESMPPIDHEIVPGEVPTPEQLGFEDYLSDPRAVLDFKGGETEGLKRLHYYLWEADLARNYFETRNELVGGDYSTKFSPWLALGCLSPKTVYWEVKRYEEIREENKSTYWIFFELLWRDFFRFMAKKHGNKIFLKGGMKGDADSRLKTDWSLFQVWSEGRTGVPFIDANMRELNQTGFMSNRGRQNVASFLVNDLKVNWQMGAEYFESLLIDYDTASNWGNWNYIAGVGNDPREDRYFNILNQASRYDPKGEYVKLWLPELRDLPPDKVHRPDTLSGSEQASLHVTIGSDYPKAMIGTDRWAR